MGAAQHHASRGRVIMLGCRLNIAKIAQIEPATSAATPTVAHAGGAAQRRVRAARRKCWLDSIIGTRQSVLMERDGMSRHTANFAQVRFQHRAAAGTIVTTVVQARGDDTLSATVVA